MANTNISTLAELAALDGITANLDGGTLRVYDDGAAQPASCDDDVPSGSTMLAEHAIPDPAFQDAVDAGTGVSATANELPDDTASSGTATWYRAFDSAGNAVIDGDVSAVGNGGDLQFESVSFAAGVTVSPESWDITLNE